MERRNFLTLAAAAPLGLGLASALPTGKKPNILYLFCDQLRACDLHCTGNEQILTPNLDRLAAEGVLMDQCYSVSPVCSPYRGQLMTGRYPWANGVERNGSAPKDGQKFLADALKDGGYTTGYIGKWHLSGIRGETDFVPVDRRCGWEYWVGVNEGKKPDKAYYFTEDGTQVPIEGMEPDFQVDRALEYIKKPHDKPYCLMISFNPPHGGKAPEKYNTYRDVKLRPNVPAEQAGEAKRQLAQYWALITWMDEAIGRLLKGLEDSGQKENTLVAFTSDHGNMIMSQNTDRKLRPWDESARVPLILRHPAGIPAGRKSQAVISSVDLYPTILGLAGLNVPSGVQGRDFSPAVRGETFAQGTMTYLSARGNSTEGPGFDWRGIRTAGWLFTVHKGGDWLLYDCKNDPYQTKNLSIDPAYKKQRDGFRALIETYRTNTGDLGELTAGVALPPPGALNSPDPLPDKKKGGDKGGEKGGKGKKEKKGDDHE